MSEKRRDSKNRILRTGESQEADGRYKFRYTPHVCRHTFCSNMATRGMPLLTLKTIMGHADVTTTANTYTHVGIDVLKDEMQSAGNKNYVVYAYDREVENPALDDDMEYDD